MYTTELRIDDWECHKTDAVSGLRATVIGNIVISKTRDLLARLFPMSCMASKVDWLQESSCTDLTLNELMNELMNVCMNK